MSQLKNSSKVLTRYIYSSNHIRSSDNTIKYAAFIPCNGETSVFSIEGLTNKEVWKIEDEYLFPKREKRSKGRADIRSSDVEENNLRVEPAEPPPRHSNIIGWKSDDEDKEHNKLLAMQLARKSKFIKRP